MRCAIHTSHPLVIRCFWSSPLNNSPFNIFKFEIFKKSAGLVTLRFYLVRGFLV